MHRAICTIEAWRQHPSHQRRSPQDVRELDESPAQNTTSKGSRVFFAIVFSLVNHNA